MFGRLMGIAFCLAVSGAAYADDYPSRAIRIVVGPGPDIVTRVFADVLSKDLGQPVVVELRPGAGGVIAAQTVGAAPPDGYLLLQATASYTINTALQSGSLDIGRDFAPVALVSTIPFVLVVHPAVPAKTLGELIAFAKADPGKLNYASAGIGTPPHMAGELFKFMAGVDIVHVPYREANSGLAAVISGAVQMMFSIASTAKSQIDGGTVRGIAVTSLKPSDLVPDLPAVAQSGLPGFEVVGWNGFVAAKATPQPIIAKLNATILRALATDEVRAKLKAAGYDTAAANSPEEFAKFIAADTEKWLNLATRINIKAN
ncbi:MAG TPA: tripartite tricarboxylate transporter substrate binding protein [Xanthobacteraceae bacterium]|jgi:tripartite-type tricarboxylate transporter receptor subunit TctC|nr:tripartite tricarboxylate transporter substrate binding protein [Xanthobacteraceae bacterium]